jgi:DNA-binding CsgD family transcriptional regulator
MEAVSVQKVQALIRCLERLYSAESLKQFPSMVVSAFGEMIEGGVFSLDIVNLKTGEVIREASDNALMSPEIRSRIVKLVSTNPATPRAPAGTKGAIRLTACTNQWQFEQAPRFLDVFVPLGVLRQTVLTLDIPGHVASVTVNRNRDFTEEEALVLSLAARHVTLAHRNLERLESLRAAEPQVVPGPQDLERVGLTPREAEVLHWVMKGKQDGAIAGILKISVRTVHQHIGHILRKLQSESRTSASYEAMLKLKALGDSSPICVAT